jgi:hypothetical protein
MRWAGQLHQKGLGLQLELGPPHLALRLNGIAAVGDEMGLATQHEHGARGAAETAKVVAVDVRIDQEGIEP